MKSVASFFAIVALLIGCVIAQEAPQDAGKFDAGAIIQDFMQTFMAHDGSGAAAKGDPKPDADLSKMGFNNVDEFSSFINDTLEQLGSNVDSQQVLDGVMKDVTKNFTDANSVVDVLQLSSADQSVLKDIMKTVNNKNIFQSFTKALDKPEGWNSFLDTLASPLMEQVFGGKLADQESAMESGDAAVPAAAQRV